MISARIPQSRQILGRSATFQDYATTRLGLVRNRFDRRHFGAGFGTGTAGADCFQLGGYNPPKCTTTAPKADNNQAAKPTDSSSPTNSSGTDQDASQDGASSPAKDQSENSSTGSSPEDSGMTACQNQSAMPIAIGLQATTCPVTQGPVTPPDSGVNACQNLNAMANSLGLPPGVCPPSSRN
ncbi:RodZ family helix-turn-helix domain-containing protein [Mycolicibacterium sphagni]|uniref:hypothetical protein n=1 Tax=Mycolicibacterium sphagni TaxID=1786 RepID=UPI0021F32027|nr:hypothetical protein [Mycolicibacterium sphagni]MCV7174977.1 hypothetical protein [Mycolicibacterium sphagni]